MRRRLVVVARSAEEFAAAAAREIVEIIGRALAVRERVAVALAGGSTPIPVYRKIATSCRDSVDWERVDLFFGDERAVAPDDDRSNYRSVSNALAPLLSRADLHRIEGELGAAEAAAAYERLLVRHFGADGARFDLVILGVGEDGHTASLFPGCEVADEGDGRLVFATRSPRPPRDRISLGYELLGGAAQILFLVRGSSKAKIVAGVSSGEMDLPATRVQEAGGVVRWVLDPGAAEGLRAGFPRGRRSGSRGRPRR